MEAIAEDTSKSKDAVDSAVEQTMRELRDRAIRELFSGGGSEVKARLQESYTANPTGVERQWPEDAR